MPLPASSIPITFLPKPDVHNYSTTLFKANWTELHSADGPELIEVAASGTVRVAITDDTPTDNSAGALVPNGTLFRRKLIEGDKLYGQRRGNKNLEGSVCVWHMQ